MSPGRPALSNLTLPSGNLSDRGIRHLMLAGLGGLFFLCTIGTLILLGTKFPLATLIVCGLAAVLPVPIYAALILWLDRYEKEPALLLASAFLWGAVVATFVSIFVNTGAAVVLHGILGPRLAGALTPALSAPIVEETSKGIALLLLYFLVRNEFNNVVDGIVYGALVGLGFAMVENILYFSRIYTAAGAAGLGYLFVMRVVFSGLIHPLFTGCTGAGLGYSRETTSGIRKVAAPIIGYFAAMMLHALWNGTGGLLDLSGVQMSPMVALFVFVPGMMLIYGVPAIVVLVLLAKAGWKREIAVIQEQLKDEVKRGTVLEGEYNLLTNTRERFRHLVGAFSKHGPSGWLALRSLYEMEVDLAFRKSQEARGEKLPSFDVVVTVDGFRERIGQVRKRLSEMGVATA
jgi:RsiW-degrading membrane proteinase PrsW (M82 family)